MQEYAIEGATAARYVEADSPRRMTETESVLVTLDKLLCVLADNTAALEDRLARVTRANPPGEDLLSVARESYETPHATAIADETDRLDSMNRRLRSLLDRLEI